MKYSHVTHMLEPVYDENSRVLILGSMPSPKSREVGFYYGNPQNRFWRVLSAVLDEPFTRDKDRQRETVLRRGIALWDVIAECDITGASDASIKNAVPNDYDRIFSACDIRAVFTVGKTAHDLYGKFGGSGVYLPSPSGANAAFSLDRLIKAYSVIKEYL